MLIYKDIVTGDEMFTDSSKLKNVDDCVWEVIVNYVTRKEGDIQLSGSNPSAEEADEGTEECVEAGYDVVLNQRLSEISFSKADFKSYLKSYSKSLAEKWKESEYSEEKITELKGKVMEAAKKILPMIESDSTFYMGESNNPDGAVGLLCFRELEGGNEEAYLVFIKAGLEEEKV